MRTAGRIALQAALVIVVGALVYDAFINAADNLAHENIAFGLGFWNNTAGFDISQTLIAYSSSTSTFGRAFWVGLLNTLLVAGIGIVLATVIGFTIGIARLSRNWLVARLAGGYVELIRNIPLLLQLLFWYNAVLKALPELRDSVALPGGGFLNNRGLFLPEPRIASPASARSSSLSWSASRPCFCCMYGRAAARSAPARSRTAWCGAWRLIFGLPLAFFVLERFSALLRFSADGPFQRHRRHRSFAGIGRARSRAFGLYGGLHCRSGARRYPCRGARSDARPRQALGLRAGTTLRLIVVPQAMRVIVPPLTSQYLNLIKNSSLAVAVGYPDLVQVFAGSVLNITGQAVEVIAITMAVYLAISLVTSLIMNFYGRTTAIVER